MNWPSAEDNPAAAAPPGPPAHTWDDAQLRLLDGADELEITTWRADGSLRPWVPIWVVVVDRNAYVRTWHRRYTGWFGHAVASRRARIEIPGLQADIDVNDVGNTDDALRHRIDDAYRTKYHRHGTSGGESMTTDDATAATLRLVPG